MKSALDAIEQHYFLRSYSDESIPARLARIETLVSGHAISGNDDERFQKLKAHILEIGIYHWLEEPGVFPLISSYDKSPELIFAWDKWHHNYGASVTKAFEKLASSDNHKSNWRHINNLKFARTVTIAKDGDSSSYSSDLNESWNQDNQQSVRKEFLYSVTLASEHVDKTVLQFPQGSRCPKINFNITFAINAPEHEGFNWVRGDAAKIFD
jgi:hypothetical protein